MRLFGLIGRPLTHSFSKEYFTRKFAREGRDDCRYELYPLASIGELNGLLQSHPELEGLNVTIPYKKEVIPYLSDRSFLPEGLDACNCIRIRERKLIGYNTDTTGFEKSLTPLLQPHHQKALVLGTGGAATAVRFVLKKLGIACQPVSRMRKESDTITYTDLDEKMIRECTLIIQCTPLGMYPHNSSCPDIPYQAVGELHLLYDLVYNPAKTLFLQKGEERGAAIKNGEEMLVLQAEESWRVWNS